MSDKRLASGGIPAGPWGTAQSLGGSYMQQDIHVAKQGPIWEGI